ncbi:DUF4129 domain-containing protein [Actinomyces sp. zg-332]|uniref:DUF4129 domain-containing protein n=1 Tax=Actinomyces sp. zg-332 TaxID=2708340 RepID=UPI00142444D6|nr:DUF4129 domain-containing protein [Actinomyces sp. zg-332]QPK94629.1 DUF4129 domain-containing protein [Actinomyces sp. zg-332]
MNILGIFVPKDIITDDDARKLLEQELSKSTYKEKKNILDIIIDYIRQLFSFSLGNSTTSSQRLLDWLVLILFVLVVSGIIYMVNKIRKNYPAKIISGGFLLDNRSYQQLIFSAKNAVKNNNDYTIGVLETYRAIIKYLHESKVLTITKNMTPNEAAEKIGAEKPEFAKNIDKATQIFNRVMYGNRLANREEYIFINDLLNDIMEKNPLYEKSYEGFGYGGIH